MQPFFFLHFLKLALYFPDDNLLIFETIVSVLNVLGVDNGWPIIEILKVLKMGADCVVGNAAISYPSFQQGQTIVNR